MSNDIVREKYNKDIPGKFGSDYEQNRWFKDERTRSGYEAMHASISRFAAKADFKRCLELGPGHGTWTKLLLEANPEASFELVDISREMLGLVQKRFTDKKNIVYRETDFLDYSSLEKFDFFFSSRAIEYIDDKEKLVKKFLEVLAPGGRAFIITKTPKYLRLKLLGRKVSEFHGRQIGVAELKRLLLAQGFSEIAFYPVTFVWPFWKSAAMNRLLYRLFGERPYSCLSGFFSESYAVTFKKA